MFDRRALQGVVLVLSLIPLAFCVLGLVFGAGRISNGALVSAELDSQFRYLSGWYLSLALLCWWIAPRIERETTVFRIVCLAVFLGGIGRLISYVSVGQMPAMMVGALVLELGAPLLVFWQAAIAKTADA